MWGTRWFTRSVLVLISQLKYSLKVWIFLRKPPAQIQEALESDCVRMSCFPFWKHVSSQYHRVLNQSVLCLSFISFSLPLKASHTWWQNKVRLLYFFSIKHSLFLILVWNCMFWWGECCLWKCMLLYAETISVEGESVVDKSEVFQAEHDFIRKS